MLRAATEAAPPGLQILAVTILTSLGRGGTEEIFGRPGLDPGSEALRLAAMAESAGVTGFVCSGEETGALRSALRRGTYLVTPGIRPVGFPAGDQARVTTPGEAIMSGADLLVIGRPITRSDDPSRVLGQVQSEVDDACLQLAAGANS